MIKLKGNTLMFVMIFVMIVFSFMLIQRASASTVNDYQAIYQKGIASGKLDKNKVSLEEWQSRSKNYYKVYQEGLAQGMYNINYEDWLDANNYGEGPEDAGNVVEKKNVSLYDFNTKQPDVQKGDVIITNSASSSGILGHAAICDRKGYILDMPGDSVADPNDNNRESTIKDWFKEYTKSKYFIKVYHAKDYSSQVLGNLVGKYAHDHYWNTLSPDSSIKNVHIPYSIFGSLYNVSKMYCSKLVYDSFWYTSSDIPLIKKSYVFETPYELPKDILYPLTVTEYDGV